MIVTFSWNVFIPLTTACRNRCHYCGFRSDNPELMGISEVKELLNKAKNASEALFTFGEKADEVKGVRERLKSMGFSDFVDYVVEMNRLAISKSKLPHTNAGILSYSELKRLKPYNASMGLMLEQAVELDCHSESPGKKPEVRIKTIKDAGKLKIPFTTGILVGIGESFYDDLYSLEVIAELHKNYEHIQECIIQNFKPKKGTPMERMESPSADRMLKIVKEAREILPDDITIQIPPNLVRDILPFIKAGAGDLGGISDTTIDYINPEEPWPSIEEIERCLNGAYVLRERLPIYPRYIKMEWGGEEVSELISRMSDDEGYRKDGYRGS
ncbi:7,8-didemethyl-8-hydroxy-5-deazariboflavin synthase subunit CofG [Archaeoglobus sulfaticallidus]|nr:7,8-didemethyl-8-hydroxy-5-deazariboflavin synthase subunit CofG [Archaeoglobus sulfaticallidus]